jgi:hypothetical protein
MYIPKYFSIKEIFPQELITLPADYLWGLMDQKLLKTIDDIRGALGYPITINNYKLGYNYSGFRPKNCSIGASKSDHKSGFAVDLKCNRMSNEALFNYIYGNQHLFPFITKMENLDSTPTWVHISTKQYCKNQTGIHVFVP